MKISVVIPTYNGAKLIAATIESVLRQTLPPDEILILDDGSKDDTVAILNTYRPRVTVIQQANRGVAAARNELCRRAGGDLIAFLDHDDLWHPKYLEVQHDSFLKNPEAVAFFTGHVDFDGYGNYQWPANPFESRVDRELITPSMFVKRYSQTTGIFGSMSFCCVPKRVLLKMGNEPLRLDGVDDSYLCTFLPLLGPVVLAPEPLVAYRIFTGAQSADRLKCYGLWVNVYELLEERYCEQDDVKLREAFYIAFALKRRRYGKLLMGAGRIAEARSQFMTAMKTSWIPNSLLKSLVLIALTYLPAPMQPSWPSSDRASGDKVMNFNLNRRAYNRR